MEKYFKRVHTPMDFIISGAIIGAGIGLLFISIGTGITLIVCGTIFFLIFRTGYKCENSSATLSYKKIEICRKYQQSVLDFLNGKSAELVMKRGNEGGTLLLEVWYNKKKCIAYAQLNTYEELSFQPISGIIALTSHQAKTITEKI